MPPLVDLIEQGRIRAVYSFRTLTDVGLSAMADGEKSRSRGLGPVQQVDSVDAAIEFAVVKHGVFERLADLADERDLVTLFSYASMHQEPGADAVARLGCARDRCVDRGARAGLGEVAHGLAVAETARQASRSRRGTWWPSTRARGR